MFTKTEGRASIISGVFRNFRNFRNFRDFPGILGGKFGRFFLVSGCNRL